MNLLFAKLPVAVYLYLKNFFLHHFFLSKDCK